MFKKILLSCIALGMGFLVTSCVPKDAPLANVSLDSSSILYQGFTGLTSVQTLSSSKVQLSWNASNDASVTTYNVYDTTILTAPKLIKTVKAPSSGVAITGLTAVNLYSFRVRASNTTGATDDTLAKEDTNTVDLGAIPYGGAISSSVIDSTSVAITYNDVSNADKAFIYCKVGLTAFDETLLATITDVSKTTYTLKNLAAGETYFCRVVTEISGILDNNTSVISFIPLGTATQLVFTTQPGSGTAGVTISTQPTVSIEDANGNVITAGPDSIAAVTLTISSNSLSLGTIYGTATVNAVKGVAGFSGLMFKEGGVKILNASKADTSAFVNGSGILTADSASFVISAGPVSLTTSSISISPPTTILVADGSSTYSVIITLKDEFGNAIAGIKPQFTSSISGDSLTQPTSITDASGGATGYISTTIADDIPPYRSVVVSSPSGLTALATPARFTAGTPTKLAFTVQPVNSPAGAGNMAASKVAIEDVNGNIVTTTTAAITTNIASNTNGAILSGTPTITSASGVSTFTDLGIDKTATGYKLIASSGSLISAYSNSFNVTAGTPQKIILSGASSVTSGSCSTAITIQLQDNGGNATNALSNTPVTISGLGSAVLYSSSACSGTPATSSVTFTAGSNTKTYYLKDLASELVTINVKDTSNVLTTGTRPISVLPDKIALSALVGGSSMSVVSGQCSPAIVITPEGDNGNAGPLFSATPVAVSGITGSSATLYSDAACTVALTPTGVNLAATNVSGVYPINIYIKDNTAEILTLNITDPSGVMSTVSSSQIVTILPSKISFTGPTSVVAGKCSTAFTIKLLDAAGTPYTTTAVTSVSVNGLSSSVTGKFYTNSACTGTGSNSTLSIPSGSSALTAYFSDTTAETLNIFLSDPNAKMTNSATIAIGISPAALQISAPSGGSSKTTICAGPFTVNTLDGAATPNVTAAINSITVNLSTSGYATGFTTASQFYSDSGCSNKITTLTFVAGDSAKSFYLEGQYPISNMTLTAADNANVLTSGTATWTISSSKGWLGTYGSNLDGSGNFAWFRTGVFPVSARQDAPSSITHLHMDSTKSYLYITDSQVHRILKYDYLNKRYIGWIGYFTNPLNASQYVKGSNHTLYPDVPSAAACVSTTNATALPGWCVGGQATAVSATTLGGLNNPQSVSDDGTYIYVANYNSHNVSRFNAASGAFAGWIGGIGSTPSNVTAGGTNAAGALASGPSSCNTTASGPTPGWCTSGSPTVNASGTNSWGYGNGTMYNPRVTTNDGTNLYVSQQGAILKFDLASGTFLGWIGEGYTTVPTGGAAGCTSLANGAITPGWCTGGTYQYSGSTTLTAQGAIANPTDIFIKDTYLYVVHTDNAGTVTQYDLNTGAFIKVLSNLSHNWLGARQMAYNSTTGYFYFADTSRVIATDLNGLVNGWVGKVSNNTGLSMALANTTDCSTLAVSADTPGWCLGGSAKAGLGETAFSQAQALVDDGQGNILVGQYSTSTVKMLDAATGVYKGSLVYSSANLNTWNTDSTTLAEYYGYGDGDLNNPAGSYNDGTYLYITDTYNGRIKKVKLSTGEIIGSIGAVTSVPTGGYNSACLSMNPMSMTNYWCTGAYPNPWYPIGNFLTSTSMTGIMDLPTGITGDGTNIYVTDTGRHAILKFDATNGTFIGWIGNISAVPTGGVAGCSSATAGTFTPGWCTGGTPTNGSGDGMLWQPTGMTYMSSSGYLYVVDNANHRISSYNASTGAFNGWIGRTNTAPSSGCTTASNGSYTVSTSGWCKGGTSQSASGPGDRGGGFFFGTSYLDFAGITNDGTNLYLSNFYNRRIDKISTGGVWLGAARTRWDQYTNVWTSTPATVASWSEGCAYPRGLWTDGSNIYYSAYNDCASGWGNSTAIIKMSVSTGTVIGWHGAIYPGNLPTTGDISACAGATTVTPGWCQSGASYANYKMGQFSEARGISGDGYFIYVTDVNTHRITRIPK